MTEKNKETFVVVRMTKAMKKELEALAKMSHRKTSDFIRHILATHLESERNSNDITGRQSF